MELRIDFHSKAEVSVRVDFAAGYPFPENETSELFLFTCFTLRQFANFGNHPVGKTLGLLLTTFDRDVTTKLAEGNYDFPDRETLGYLMDLVGVRISIDYDELRQQIMPGLPKQVRFRGEGKKAFVATVPPFLLQFKGFDPLGFQLNYFAFQSVFAFFRYLAQQHIDDGVYLDHISAVARLCGRVHITKGIPIGDQVSQAYVVLKELGMMP